MNLTDSNVITIYMYALAFTFLFLCKWEDFYLHMYSYGIDRQAEWIPEEHLERHDGSHSWMDDE